MSVSAFKASSAGLTENSMFAPFEHGFNFGMVAVPNFHISKQPTNIVKIGKVASYLRHIHIARNFHHVEVMRI
jgi:hypothetical protein